MPRLMLLIVLSFPSLAFAGWTSVGSVDSFAVDQTGARFRSGPCVLRIDFLAPDLVRVRFAQSGTLRTDPSWAVIKTDWPALPFATDSQTDRVSLASTEMRVVVMKNPIRMQFQDGAGSILNEDEPSKGMAWNGREVRVWKRMPQDEFYYGLGEKAGRLQRKFSHTTMWNSDIPAYGADTDPLYQTVPFFYGMKNGKAYGLFFDNTYWSSFDFGKESRTQYSFGAENGELDYYFFQGPAPSKILQRYTELVGRMPLPPLWSLGYQQCRWSYAPESRVREIARGFRSRNIPCDVIYLDIDYMDGYRIFTWNKTGFPDPARMISDLSDDGFHIAVIVDPGIKADTVYHAYRSGRAGDHFIKYPDGRTFIGKVWPGLCAFPDFTNAAARTWWGENFSVLTSAGIRGWWNDMNEPSVFDVPTKTVDLDVVHRADGFTTDHAASHNIYGMQMTRATYDGVRTLLPNERPFVLTRASYAGGQRYSAAWTGDNVASWDHLRMAVSMCLSMSISGQPFVGSDIGGFIGYPSGELFTRWLQFGVFSPLMRAHSVINEKNKEPWEFGDDLTAINRETINLRYRLLPYIYNCMRQASVTGIPPMRPMIFSYPDDAENIWNDDQFMFGDDLLVAPVINAGATSREVRLPRGTWYDFRTGVPHEGGRTITVAAPLQEIPIFVRAGAIIPTRPIVQYTQQAPIDPLTFILYPTELQSTSTYYEDDGISFKYEKGGSLERVVNQWYSSEKITITLGSCRGTYAPSRRSLALRVVNIATAPKEIQLNGRQLLADSPSSARSSSTGWSYDPATKIVTVTFPDARDEQRLAILR